MVLLCGIPSETPLALVAERLDELGLPYVTFNQRRFAETEIELEIVDGRASGILVLEGIPYGLEAFTGVYTRLMDDQLLIELREEPPQSPLRARCRSLHETLGYWLEVASARVVNRARPQGSNFSKPYQAQLIRAHGFSIPETLITNRPELVREFLATHGRLVYKSISGVRSIVQTLGPDDLARLERIRWCPVQFQAFVEGTNVRVHTLAGQLFATAIASDVTDYRYAHRQEGSAELEAIELPDSVVERCLRLVGALDLPFAGIDLKLTPDGEVFCFEVNPSPAFSYYESQTGQPISRALALFLASNDGSGFS